MPNQMKKSGGHQKKEKKIVWHQKKLNFLHFIAAVDGKHI